MADDGVACSYSVEEIKSLTIPKLKAELTRLNHPIGSIKRKPQLVAALTVNDCLNLSKNVILNQLSKKIAMYFVSRYDLQLVMQLDALCRDIGW